MGKEEKGKDKGEGIQSKGQRERGNRMDMPYTWRRPLILKEAKKPQKEKGKYEKIITGISMIGLKK